MRRDGAPFKGVLAAEKESPNLVLVNPWLPEFALGTPCKWLFNLKALELPACAALLGFDGSSSTPVTYAARGCRN